MASEESTAGRVYTDLRAHPGKEILASVIVAILVLLVGILLRFIYLFQKVWWDEGVTIRFVREYTPLELLWEVPLHQPHFGPYYTLVGLWVDLSGLPVISARGLSLVAGVGVLVGIYYVMNRTVDGGVAIFTAAICASAPILVIQSGWLRMYALLTLLTVCSWGLIAVGSQRWLWAGCSIGLIWLHPFGLFVVATQVAWLVVDRHRVEWRPTIAVTVGAIPAVGILLAKVFRDSLGVANGDLSGATLKHIVSEPSLQRIVLTPAVLVVGRINLKIQYIASVVVLVLFALAVYRRWDESMTRLLTAWALGPIVLAASVSYLATPIYQAKYLVVSSPAVVALVVLGSQTLGSKAQYTALIVIVLAQLAALHHGLQDPTWYALRVIP